MHQSRNVCTVCMKKKTMKRTLKRKIYRGGVEPTVQSDLSATTTATGTPASATTIISPMVNATLKKLSGFRVPSILSGKIAIIQSDYEVEIIRNMVSKYPPTQNVESVKATFNLLYGLYWDVSQVRVFVVPPSSTSQPDSITLNENLLKCGEQPNSSAVCTEPDTKMIERLVANMMFVLYPYLLNVANQIRLSTTQMDEQTAEIKQLTYALLRRIDAAKKPMWVGSIATALELLFSEGYDKTNDLFNTYENMSEQNKHGVNVYMHVYKRFNNEGSINNPRCKGKPEYEYRATAREYNSDVKKSIDSFINTTFYEDKLNEEDTLPVATYKTDILHTPNANP